MNDPKLENLLTYDNVKSYANAISQVGETLYWAQNEGYTKIVMPSRGAFPFYYKGLLYYYNFCKSRKDFVAYSLKFNKLYLPFTADLGSSINNSQFDSSSIRRFWVKLLADQIHNYTTPYTKYYNHLVSTVGNGLGLNTTPLIPNNNFQKGEKKFLFIDTAISGRAITEIMQSFDENYLDYFIILIVGHNGNRLEERYSRIINEKIAHSKLKLIKTTNIFSEDTTPILNSGISSLVFENIIDITLSEISEFKNNNLFGCGLWYLNSVANIYGTDLNYIRGVLDYLINRFIDEILNSRTYNKIEFEDSSSDIIKVNQKYDILNQETTRNIVMSNIKSKSNLITTGSHILRVSLDHEIVNTYKNGIKNIC
ncbi:hypothetical protein [Aquirufa aurantiipilula]|uniref:Uncharacterized protein n=1 Tax=Aquirufa aurantiipilula TaxID=2696561 RepID=A0ABT6BIP3_9BACT|nr:hypothetical protein [Aquirufa aurantiipilula]MDF5690316.1 hypothetical protein [Aquirufa aurantiipilula]